MYGFELKKIDLSFSNYKNSRTFAPVIANLAQLVEQRIRNAKVWGSSPQIGSNRGLSDRQAFVFKPKHYIL